MNEAQLLFTAVFIVAGLSFLILAAVSRFRGPNTDYLRYWTAFCFVGSAWAFSVVALGQLSDAAHAHNAMRLSVTLGSTAMYCFFRFAVAFASPIRREQGLKRVALFWYLLLQPLFWFTKLVIVGATTSEFSRWAPEAGPLILLYSGYLLLTGAVPCFIIVKTYRASQGLKRIQAGYMLVAFSILPIAALGSLLPAMLKQQTLTSILPALLFPLLPLTITYAIVRHRLWDVRTIIHKTIVWLLLSFVALVPLYIALRWGAELLPPMERGSLALLLGIFIIAAHLYLRTVQPKLDHRFQRRAYDARQVLDQFALNIVGVGKPSEIGDLICDALKNALYPEQITVLGQHRGIGQWSLLAETTQTPSSDLDISAPHKTLPSGLDLFNPFFRYLASSPMAIDLGQIAVDAQLQRFRDSAETAMRALNAQVIVPLVRGGQLIGLISVGIRQNLKPYSRADLEFIEQLAAEGSKGLANALLFEEVDQQRKELKALTTTLEQRVTQRTVELQAANERLTQLDRYKSRFFANITHELRTPLTMILAPLESLEQGELGPISDDQRAYLNAIWRNALRLLKLINNLLDLAKLEENKLELHIERIDLSLRLQHIVEYARPLAGRKELALLLECEHAPDDLFVDPEQFERVIINLISNALKFTDPGGTVTLHVSATDRETLIDVRDTGCGIPDDKLSLIFERFSQTDSSITRRYGGTGIGLAFVREIVELHGGRVSVVSTVGNGSTFTVTLPRGTAHLDPRFLTEAAISSDGLSKSTEESEQEPKEWTRRVLDRQDFRFLDIEVAAERRRVARPNMSSSAAQTRVLVVEDNLDVVRFIHLLLQREHAVYVAQDGVHGLELARREAPDVIITDYMMPEMDGLSMLVEIRNDPRTADIPVIMLTAKDQLETRLEVRRAGADIYLNKPFSPQELLTSVRQLLEKRGRAVAKVIRAQVKSLESISGGLAHEINNPLSYIRNSLFVIAENAQLIVEKTKTHDRSALDSADFTKAQERIERMQAIAERGVKRIEQIVQLLRSYSREGYPTVETEMKFDQAVHDVISLIAPKDGAAIELIEDLQAPETTISCFSDEMQQVIRNLIQNAIDAGATRVIARTRVHHRTLQFEVIDNGAGIPHEIRDKIFTPFFSTKSPGKGMGLGLAIVHQVVTQAGGIINLEDHQPTGTCFRVELPIRTP